MRVLVTVSPRLYREAVASSLQNTRPGIEVRAAAPEDADLELAGFKPHLFVHNDTVPVPEWALSGLRSRVEIYDRAADEAAMRSDEAAYLEALRACCRAGRDEALRIRRGAA